MFIHSEETPDPVTLKFIPGRAAGGDRAHEFADRSAVAKGRIDDWMLAKTLENILSDFELLEDWEDRYRYVIELGRSLPPFLDAARTEANKVRGCASQVWLASEVHDNQDHAAPSLRFQGDSDALIVRGLIAILFATYSYRRADEILATETRGIFHRLGLSEHLTPQRSNGFAAMVARIRADARRALESGRKPHCPSQLPGGFDERLSLWPPCATGAD